MAVPVLALAIFAAGSLRAVSALARARWPHRSPAVAILLWQALGLGWGLAAVGALAGLSVAGQHASVAGGVTALASRLPDGGTSGLLAFLRLACLAAAAALLLLLAGLTVVASLTVLRARRRQRLLLSLLARGDPKVPGALVVDHPAAAAYCVPGLRSAIVISAGTLDLLDNGELAAVLIHERAHLRERHDLVLLPFTALLRAFGWSVRAREACRAVALLVEMLADDYVLRRRPARELASALLRFGAAGAARVPSGALAVSQPGDGGELAVRVERLLLRPRRLAPAAVALVCCLAGTAVALPVALLLIRF
jgi:Zn-dependent protease with chaperone function